MTHQDPLLNTKTKEKKKSTIKKTILAVVCYFIGFFTIQYIINNVFSKPLDIDKLLVEITNEINKTCPRIVDQYTRLDNTFSLPNKVFQYNYSLLETEKSQIDLDTFRAYMIPSIIKNLKATPDMELFRDKVTINYYYKDKNGEFVDLIKITPDLYKDSVSLQKN